MAKGKGQVQLQLEIDNEEEWENLVTKEGLILVDVYTEWCGPCSGMAGNLRKIKLEQGGDTLTLAMAKCDNIQCLNRFRNKSRPTWMFISNCRMIRLLFGANAPTLTKVILEELQKTRNAIESKMPRTGIDFDQLTDEEQEIADREQRIRDEQERIEREARERAINERRESVVENLSDPMKEFNFVLIWPHVKHDGVQQIMSAIKDLAVSTVGKPTKLLLTEENLFEMFYYGTWRYNELEIAELLSDEITGLLFSLGGAEENEMVELFLEKLYGPCKHPPGDENSLAVRLAKEKPIPKPAPPPEEEEEDEHEEEDKNMFGLGLIEPRKSLKASLTDRRRSSQKEAEEEPEEEEKNTFMVPAIYVPENEKCKILAMRILFPAVTVKFDLPEPEPIPPHLIVAFDAFKINEIMELAEAWPEETMCLGFFTSTVPEEAKLLCKTAHQYDRLMPKPVDAKLVVQVSKKKSEPLLSYSSLGPVYVSPNCVIGEQEAAVFFPEGYDEPEPEPEPEPTKKSKKKKKKAKTSKTSLTAEEEQEASPEGSDELEEGEGDFEDEGEYEDEGEEEDMGDDDDMDIFGGFDPSAGMDLIAPPAPELGAAPETGAPPEGGAVPEVGAAPEMGAAPEADDKATATEAPAPAGGEESSAAPATEEAPDE